MTATSPRPDAAAPPLARFEFTRRTLDPSSGRVRLFYRLWLDGRRHDLEERFEFGPGPGAGDARDEALAAALDLLHWAAGVSYWKTACRGVVAFGERAPDDWQAAALETLYRDGLAELAWRNDLGRRYWPAFTAGVRAAPRAGAAGLPGDAVLVPMGGGKDSLVALERVRRRGVEPETVQVGSAGLIGRVAARAGTRHLRVERRLAPELAALNAAGAVNGHVPVTAINAAALIVLALLRGRGAVVFANERSADHPTLIGDDGVAVNHQFAKSFAFETLLAEWIRRYVATDLAVFSILRRDRELAVCREFASLTNYHDVFSSCNRNFHLDGTRTARWCGDCPKCRFVFLGLAPFLAPARMRAIFGTDLLADPGQRPGFEALLALDGALPFECVGEPDEARAALRLLGAAPAWREHAVVRTLQHRLQGAAVPDAAALMQPAGPHLIPDRFA